MIFLLRILPSANSKQTSISSLTVSLSTLLRMPSLALLTLQKPRSTVGTTTEIYEYLRLLFARIGRTYSPISGQEVKKHSTEDIIQCTQQYAPGTKFLVLAPIYLNEGRTLEQQLKIYVQNGYTRLADGGNVIRIDDFLAEDSSISQQQTDASHKKQITPVLIKRCEKWCGVEGICLPLHPI
jgi:excinuclease UvrABC ATPase subunit